MIRQICPQCFAAVELPLESAGRDAPCPKCGKSIAVPAAYAPSVSASGGLSNLDPTPPKLPTPTRTGTNPMSEPITPPPGLNASAAPPPIAPMPSPSADSGPRSCGVTVSPTWLDWVPAVCFTVILALTLFNWIGIYPGGVRVYSQSPWHALVGEMSTNGLPDELLTEEKYFEGAIVGNRWLIAYFPLLFIALLLAWLDRIIRNPTVASVPGPLAWLPRIWPHRYTALTVLGALMLVLILAQTWRGYGLETAVKQKVTEKYAKQIEEADSTPKKQRVAVNMGEEMGRYQLQGTTPLNAAIALHAVAFLALLTSSFVHRRGNKPFPRVALQY